MDNKGRFVKGHSLNKKTGTEKPCSNCGKVKYFKKFNIREFNYCSQPCYWRSLKGKPSWNKGRPWSEEERKRMSESSKGIRFNTGKTHFKKGLIPWNKDEKYSTITLSKPEYKAVHHWISKQSGKASYCSFDKDHKSRVYHWANISGSYLQDINDYSSLCVRCHSQYDRIRSGRTSQEKGGSLWLMPS